MWVFILLVAILSVACFELGRVYELRCQEKKRNARKITVNCTCPKCDIH